MPQKPNLVLIHPFPMNQDICSGLIEYLNEIFKVYFIELPGFGRNKDLCGEVSISEFVHYVSGKLAKLNLDSYILGGISFGFLIAAKVAGDRKCKMLLASEPFLGEKYLNISWRYKKTLLVGVKIILLFRSWNTVWRNKWFVKFLSRRYPRYANNILNNTDPYAFFKTLAIILSSSKNVQLPKKKCILLANPNDSSINYKKTFNFMTSQLGEDLKLVITDAPHFPKDPSPQYFKKVFTSEKREILDYLRSSGF